MNVNAKARKVLQELNFDFSIFTLDGFLQAAGRSKGRQIEVVPCNLPPDVLGIWLTDETAPVEYISYQRRLPEIQQIHVQLHEVSHFLMGHETRRINRQAIIEAAGRGDVSLLDEVTQLRSSQTTNWEKEAETLSSMIQKQVIRHSKLDLLTYHNAPAGELASFLREMGN